MDLTKLFAEGGDPRVYIIDQKIEKSTDSPRSPYISVMRVGSNTFGDPIFQNGLQN